jgi:hypothetical protein
LGTRILVVEVKVVAPAHGIKVYGGAEVQLHSFWNLTLDGVEFKDRR